MPYTRRLRVNGLIAEVSMSEDAGLGSKDHRLSRIGLATGPPSTTPRFFQLISKELSTILG